LYLWRYQPSATPLLSATKVHHAKRRSDRDEEREQLEWWSPWFEGWAGRPLN
jgi:hypothetical protein